MGVRLASNRVEDERAIAQGWGALRGILENAKVFAPIFAFVVCRIGGIAWRYSRLRPARLTDLDRIVQ